MVKASLLVLIVLTIIVAFALKAREGAVVQQQGGIVARGRSTVRRWFNAAAISVGITLVVLAIMHWLRLSPAA